MIQFSEFNSAGGKEDQQVGISISSMVKKEGLNAYGTTIGQGRKIGCHSHAQGEEWYIILSGEGEIWTADIMDGKLINSMVNKVAQGSVFCIYANTAHQLVAKSDLALIFLCPESHITCDRTLYADLVNNA